MEAAFIVVRAVHMAAVVALFGGLVFDLCIDPEHLRSSSRSNLRKSPQWISRSACWLLLAFFSAAVWLGFEAVEMSGLPASRALLPGTLGVVLRETHFGHVWTLRCILALTLAGLLVAALRKPARRDSWLVFVATLLAALLIASLAWAGHASAERGTERWVHLGADVLHLWAAGAWVGALPSLVGKLRSSHNLRGAAVDHAVAHATRRFSVLGVISVAVLIASGLVNAWFTVGSFPALWSTHYGHLLLVKLALFATMLVLAAVNGVHLTPLLSALGEGSDAQASARRQLRRNATIETLLGVLVLCIVGAIGVTMPAAHSPLMTPSMHMR
jgi:putative copper resistance protein D